MHFVTKIVIFSCLNASSKYFSYINSLITTVMYFMFKNINNIEIFDFYEGIRKPLEIKYELLWLYFRNNHNATFCLNICLETLNFWIERANG